MAPAMDTILDMRDVIMGKDEAEAAVATKARKVDRDQRTTVGVPFVEEPRMICREVNVFYGDKHAINNVSIDVGKNEVLAMIGPSGCGKSTFLRCLNRMNDLVDGTRVEGEILLGGTDINGSAMDVIELRRRVGMVFQKSNPFPKSIYENVVYGLRIAGVRDRAPHRHRHARRDRGAAGQAGAGAQRGAVPDGDARCA